MKYKYIAIEREYGSGGTKIGQLLAEQTGIPCYGKEILEEVAREHHVSLDTIQQHEEKNTGSLLYTMFLMSKVNSGDTDMVTKEGKLYLEEQKQIRKLAAQGPAIFLGHCAVEALKDKRGVVTVFIRCSKEEKQKRIREDYQIPEERIETTRKAFDRKRANYYRANTEKEWNNPQNYDIVLDSSRLGIEGCAAVLKGLLTETD